MARARRDGFGSDISRAASTSGINRSELRFLRCRWLAEGDGGVVPARGRGCATRRGSANCEGATDRAALGARSRSSKRTARRASIRRPDAASDRRGSGPAGTALLATPRGAQARDRAVTNVGRVAVAHRGVARLDHGRSRKSKPTAGIASAAVPPTSGCFIGVAFTRPRSASSVNKDVWGESSIFSNDRRHHGCSENG
jgi:hypothetical protein